MKRITILTITMVFGLFCANTGAGNISLSVVGTKPGSLTPATTAKSSNKVAAAVTTGSNSLISIKDKNGTAIGTITITDARLGLKEIKLKLDENETKDDADKKAESENVKYKGPYLVNLLTNTVTPSLANISIPTGTYKEIELKLDKFEGDEKDDAGDALVASTDALYNHSITVTGTYTGLVAGSQVTNVALTMNFDIDEEIKLSGSSSSVGFPIDGSADLTPIIIAFRMNKWFAFNNSETNSNSLDFSDVTLTNNAIVLTQDATGNNAEIRKVIKNNIEESADYGEDKDGDGELGKDEDDDPDSSDSQDD